VEERHLQQALKISELRRRNMLVKDTYKHIHFVGAGKVWLDYHLRLIKALKVVEREEFRRKPDEEEVKQSSSSYEEDEDEEDESGEDEEL
jgi:hypothetical protein